MDVLAQQVHNLAQTVTEAIGQARNAQELEQVRLKHLTRQSELALLMASLKTMNPEQRAVFGPQLNALRDRLQKVFDEKKGALQQAQYAAENAKTALFDVTAYKPGQLKGSLHPYTPLIARIEDVFISMGYSVVDGPELEDEWTNFEALNVAKHHPARDMQDTLWLQLPQRLMRTHTSSIQVRTMLEQKPPFAVVATGRAYRYEATDASHDYVFVQTECLLVDKHITLSHLLGTIRAYLSAFFDKKDLGVRVNPTYYPFVEPGIECHMQCVFCKHGCSVCKHTRWIEIGGAGMVHPNVFKACNIDPAVYRGFAFGFGTVRLAMLRHALYDVRLLHSADIEFLSQF